MMMMMTMMMMMMKTTKTFTSKANMMEVECIEGKLKPAELDQGPYRHRCFVNNSRALKS